MPSTEQYDRRLARVRRAMRPHDIDCLLLNQRDNIRYLTGADSTCSWIFLKEDGRLLALVLEPDCYYYRKQSIVDDIRVFRTHDPLALFREIGDELKLAEAGLAVEKEHLRLSQFQMLADVFGSRLHESLDAGCIAQEAEIVKMPEDIERIAMASRLATLGITVAEQVATRTMTEEQLASHVLDEMRREGADSDSYVYAAAGDRSSLVHAFPTHNQLGTGPVVLDVHAVYQG